MANKQITNKKKEERRSARVEVQVKLMPQVGRKKSVVKLLRVLGDFMDYC